MAAPDLGASFLGLLIGTVIFIGLAAIMHVVSCFTFKNKSLIRVMIWVAAACMWLIWFTIYSSQMVPLIAPEQEWNWTLQATPNVEL
ncbi:hypothetical protein PAPYR_4025 [Paratrimastix pyriformis]|uniref:ATP synthase subunit H n=1 Tax=Paratrimastix pyriformis TaxID=342808 RepID=A0ABQ8UMB3_9EUKA|nr:hypothetical protein PAPYR_4025 [Paratrimastix pyriformis]